MVSEKVAADASLSIFRESDNNNGQISVGIRFEGLDGLVQHDQSKKEFRVEHPNESVVKAVTEYLNTEREFWIPESDRIDDFRIDTVMPGESRMYAELALSSMYSRTGVLVLWSRKT